MSCGVDHRHCLDLALLWLWCGLAAVAPIILLAWEPPYATGVALEKTKQKNKQKKKQGRLSSLAWSLQTTKLKHNLMM